VSLNSKVKKKLSLSLVKHHVIRPRHEMEVTGHLHAPIALPGFTYGEEASGKRGLGGLVSPRFGLIAVEKRKIENISCVCREIISDFSLVHPLTQFLFRQGYPSLCQHKFLRKICVSRNDEVPITVAAHSKAWTVFARSNAGIVGLNHTQRHACLCVLLFCVCVVLCVGSSLVTGWSLVQGVLPPV
jgi:hypothetical protein